MKIIGTSGSKALSIIPRSFYSGSVALKLTSESTGTSVTVTAFASTSGNYMTFAAQFGTLTEGDFYSLEVSVQGVLVYRDRVFCTDQTINQANNDYYSVNDGEYTTENSFDIDYIIL